MIIPGTPIFKLAEFCMFVFLVMQLMSGAKSAWSQLYNFDSKLFCLEFFNIDDRQFAFSFSGLIQLLVFQHHAWINPKRCRPYGSQRSGADHMGSKLDGIGGGCALTSSTH